MTAIGERPPPSHGRSSAGPRRTPAPPGARRAAPAAIRPEIVELRHGRPGYPARLGATAYAPARLWVWGHLPQEDQGTVGIVGTRRMTEYGHRIAREVAGALAAAGAVVVSGLAQGIDSTAHTAALAVGGCTVAVLGEGLVAFETTGPIVRRRIAHAILERGAVISQYALERGGAHWTFPRRNATIAALSDVLVVVEAPAGSGSLITAGFAKELGRGVFAVPGPLGASTWEGSNALIAAGDATLLVSAEQVASRLGLRLLPPSAERRAPAADRVLDLLAEGPRDTDAIGAGIGMSAAEAALLIAELLIGGSIVATADGRFARR